MDRDDRCNPSCCRYFDGKREIKNYDRIIITDNPYLQNYINTNIKIKKELEIQSNNNIEGMQNFTSEVNTNSKRLNMNDINGMLTDTDLIVLQGNYSYILWSILAVGVLTITINTMKK
jgi:hypothetical protein